MIIFQVILRTC